MLDGVTLDQLRTFIAAADEGSFSAAGRKLKRAQSVVSQTLGNLELQLGVLLFDRSTRKPTLTEQGRALLLEARDAARSMDLFKAKARRLAGGLEPEVSAVIDVMFPIEVLTTAVREFRAVFPETPLRLYVEALGAVLKPVIDGVCDFGIVGSLPTTSPDLVKEKVLSVRTIMVAAPHHPLCTITGPIPRSVLEEHIQLVLTDRTTLSSGREFGVFSNRTWRLADLGAKLSFLRAGLGWGSMPRGSIEADLASGELVQLQLEDAQADEYTMPMSIIYPAAKPPGMAGRWLMERLKNSDCAG
ncbi:LysR family transcriptional regulator [Allomesorhizobium camelthorni]|uniref:LysR family transcriptional regulator n=1 Tax=Allomesorhizobium camelthorni TaxID=475069 RepID=A0A6G4WM49_9HYPH|nr:LysR family transcriptional regulator [Mesorhizobium camelthorni]NGO55147.1 LysR family transcriptional regulator [Mesorhizobium camelthorni]